MSILCGIDFSEFSSRALEVAAGLAARLKLPLHLVHSLADWPGDAVADEKTSLVQATKRALEGRASKLRAAGIEVYLQVEFGPPAHSLIRAAKDVSAKFILIGVTGRGQHAGRFVGGTADLLAQQSHVPVLAVRDVEPFQLWLRGDRPLRVLVGLDFNVVSDEAWRWANALVQVGPVELVGTYVYWPPHEFYRLGLGGMRSFVNLDPDVDKVLRRELESRFAGEQDATVRFRLAPGMGKPSDHLLSIVAEEKPDLVVVGSHQRSAIARLWEGSVSRGVLHYATTSVACVPIPMGSKPLAMPRVRTALAATDFSPVGNSAIAYAYGQVERGGRVYLIHVLEPVGRHSPLEPRDTFEMPEASEAQVSATEQLRLLIPTTPDSEDTGTEIVVLEAKDAADAIAQAADRLGVDVICMGTHGRSGVLQAILGSVAQAVLVKTQRPVLLVRPRKE